MTRYRINPGEFRHKVTIEENRRIQNDYGEEVNEWQKVAETYAAIYPINGREFFAAESVNSEVTHKIQMRYICGIKPDMRVKYDDRIFHIQSVINFQERNVLLQLMCKELFL